jgi:hypothetical protein
VGPDLVGMAQKTVVLLEDDLDGGPAEQTVRFALDGVSYEIDLSAANAQRLRGVVQPYVAAGRRVGGRGARVPVGQARGGGAGAVRADREQLAAIREWARARGMPVSNRGRIPERVIAAYHAPPDTAAVQTADIDGAAAVPAVTFTAPAPPRRRARGAQ